MIRVNWDHSEASCGVTAWTSLVGAKTTFGAATRDSLPPCEGGMGWRVRPATAVGEIC